MPAPYSDNLYSADANPWDDGPHEDDALSPTDGYFHASSAIPHDDLTASSPPSHHGRLEHQRQSSNVPFVPNVMVEDPTLQQDRAAAKAKEAEEERLINETTAGRSTPFNPTQTPHHHHHQQDPRYPHGGSHQPTSPSFDHPNLYPALRSPFSQPVSYHHTYSQASTSTAPRTTKTTTTFSTSPPISPTHRHRRSIDEEITPQFASVNTAGLVPNQYAVHPQADAPPAYSPSPSSPQPSSDYQTFASPTETTPRQSPMGSPAEHEALLPRGLQSMGGPSGNPGAPVWDRLKASTNSPNTRKKIRTLLGVLVILSIVFAIFGSVKIGSPNHRKSIIDKTPVKMPVTNPEGSMVWRPQNSCRDTPQKTIKVTERVEFGRNKRLSVVQNIAKEDRPRQGQVPHVYGNVFLQNVGHSSTGGIELEVIANYKDLNIQIRFDRASQRFEVTTPRYLDWEDQHERPCIQIRIIVSIPNDSILHSFTVETTHLDIEIQDGIVLSSSDFAHIRAVAGDIRTGKVTDDLAPYTLASRRVEIETISGDIDGWFPLYDLLKVDTVSGNAKTYIGPKLSTDKHPEPALLEASSTSGNLELHEPLELADSSNKKLPTRDYRVRATTAAGDITAELAFTSQAKFESKSGDLRLKLLPLFGEHSGEKRTELLTDTTSGQTNVNVLEPVWRESTAGVGNVDPMGPREPHHEGGIRGDGPVSDDPWIIINPEEPSHTSTGPPPPPPPPHVHIDPHLVIMDEEDSHLLSLKSHHASISGDVKLVYPPSWEGKFLLSTISGRQSVYGKDLHYSSSKGYPKQVQGIKGDGGSEITVHSVSGDENLTVGNV